MSPAPRSYTTQMSEATPPVVPPEDPDTLIDRGEASLDRLLEWIRAVDAKTPVVMAIDTAMLGVIAATAPGPDHFCASTWLWIAVGTASLVVSLSLCALATFPQTKGPEGSLIYFGGIASRSLPGYIEAARSRTKAEHLDDLLKQCHRNAEIAASKFKYVRLALFWLVGGILPWLVAVYTLVAAR